MSKVIKTTFQCLVIAIVFFISSGNLMASISFSTKWREVSDDTTSKEWIYSGAANIGFTTNKLEMQIDLTNGIIDNEHFLSLTPTFIDSMDIRFLTNENSNNENLTIKIGDKREPHVVAKHVAGHYLIPIPKNTSVISVIASSTSSLQLRPSILTIKEAEAFEKDSLFIQGCVITIIAFSFVLGLIAFLSTHSLSTLTYALYELAWVILISGIQSPIPLLDFSSIAIANDKIVSFGAIFATITGAFCHGFVFKELLKQDGLAKVLFLTGFTGVALMGALMLGLELQALSLNVTLISLVPILVIVLLLLPNRKPLGAKNESLKIRIIYITLMLTVMITGISGTGAGSLFNITYIHALLTTLLLGYVMIIGIRQQVVNAIHTKESLALSQKREQETQLQLKESMAFLSMLSHEIKTPLTTIKFLISSAQNRSEISYQLDSIERVINQTLIAAELDNTEGKPVAISLKGAILEAWASAKQTSAHRSSQLNLRCSNNDIVNMDPFILSIILGNLLSNAQKYSPPGTNIRVFAINNDNQTSLCICNKTEQLADTDVQHIFKKYWRSEQAKRTRGSGLGLWIIKLLCKRSTIQLSLRLKQKNFRICITIPKTS